MGPPSLAIGTGNGVAVAVVRCGAARCNTVWRGTGWWCTWPFILFLLRGGGKALGGAGACHEFGFAFTSLRFRSKT